MTELLGLAHRSDPEYVKWIWWYSIVEDRLEGYDLSHVEKHGSSKFTLITNQYDKCARGRVVLFKGKFYLLIWTPGYIGYSDLVIEKIRRRVEDIFKIDYVIDECGNDLEKR
jgi:hypothetical protein